MNRFSFLSKERLEPQLYGLGMVSGWNEAKLQQRVVLSWLLGRLTGSLHAWNDRDLSQSQRSLSASDSGWAQPAKRFLFVIVLFCRYYSALRCRRSLVFSQIIIVHNGLQWITVHKVCSVCPFCCSVDKWYFNMNRQLVVRPWKMWTSVLTVRRSCLLMSLWYVPYVDHRPAILYTVHTSTYLAIIARPYIHSNNVITGWLSFCG